MTRQRQFAAPGTLFLFFLSACAADGTGPDDERVPAMVMDRLALNIGDIDVIHDCDPAWDNPGDFQGYVEIWQDPNPGGDDYQLVAASPRRTILLNSGESANGDHIRVSSMVPRDRTRPVLVRGVFQELDNGVADARAERVEIIRWNVDNLCWAIAGSCLTQNGSGMYYEDWQHHVHTRDDVWNPFNSNDEGCEFHVTFEATVGGS